MRCTTRSRSNQLSDNSDTGEVLDKSVELQRDNDQDDSFQSNACISPIAPYESPWADRNPYNCLDVDSEPKSDTDSSSPAVEEVSSLEALDAKCDDSSEELYGATTKTSPGPEPEQESPVLHPAMKNLWDEHNSTGSLSNEYIKLFQEYLNRELDSVT